MRQLQKYRRGRDVIGTRGLTELDLGTMSRLGHATSWVGSDA